MTDESASAGQVRDKLARARNFLRDAQAVAANYKRIPQWSEDPAGREFLEIEREVALLRVRRWTAVVGQLEDTARFLGA